SSLRGLGESMAAGVRAELPRGVELPRWLARVLDRGLERDPAARWPSMDALLDALLDDPAIRRRRWIFAGTLALLAGVVGLGSWAQEQRARAACEAAGEAVFEDWSPASQERLQTAFAATGLSYAQDSAERSVVGLERWAQSWAAARVQACEDGRAGDDEAALRATCLERQRWQLASTVALFAEADATTVEALVARAVPMIAALPRPAACAEPGALQAVAAAGEQAATGEFERARRELSLVAVDERAGRYEQALTRAEEARALADTLEDDALRAEVLAALGSVQLKRGDYHPAEATLRAGYFLASGIGHDPVAAQAGISLMSAVGYHGARPTEGFDWAEHVRAATRRMGEEHPGPRFFEVLGYVQTAAAEYGAAVASFERAVALRVELHGAEHPGLAEPLGDLGTVHQILGDLERAEEYNRRALEIRERALGPHHPDVGLTLRELGHVAQLRKDFAGAERLYRSALTVQEAALGPDHAEVALTLGALGVVLREQGSLDEALATHERALAVAQRSLGDHPEVARYHTNLGATLARLGRLEDALAQHRSGLELRERLLGPDHHALEESLNNLGMALERRGAYEEALAHYRRALVLEERALGPEHASVAFTLDNVGVALTALGRVEEALQVLRRALAIREAVLEAGHADFAASHDALGEALLVAGRVDEALAAHRAALAIREATRGPEHVLTAMTRRRLADALQERGDLDEALARYRQALTVQEADGGAPDELARVRIGLGRALLERGEREAAVAQLERARAAMVGSEFDPLLLAQASFALARALPSQGAGRGRARALARSSLEILESLGSRGDALRRALEEWSRRGDRGP
ncbi:MAG: tetratricopeptide repeat protein, partial [Myxococcales bacterium]|nr:tetratricopeptide repeat protein [Myxococcales bacterium]